MKTSRTFFTLLLSGILLVFFLTVQPASGVKQTQKQHTEELRKQSTLPSNSQKKKEKDKKKKGKKQTENAPQPSQQPENNGASIKDRTQEVHYFFLNSSSTDTNKTRTPQDSARNAQSPKDSVAGRHTANTAIILDMEIYNPEDKGKELRKGKIVIRLYPDTALNRIYDIYAYLIGKGSFNGMRFHRVIKDFMIQGGDPTSRKDTFTAEELQMMGANDVQDSLLQKLHITSTPFVAGQPFQKQPRFHKYGSVAIARVVDDRSNPERNGSLSQFYIVTDTMKSVPKIVRFYEKRRLNKVASKKYYSHSTDDLPDIVYDTYRKQGGAPYLDEDYVVIGEVIHGMDLVRAIQNLKTNNNDFPSPGYAKIVKATIRDYKIKDPRLK